MSDLFKGPRLSEVFDAEIEGIKKENDKLPKDVILQEDFENLAIQLVSKYEKKQINILWDQLVQEEPQEATRIERGAFRRPQEVRATNYTLIIPFEGDPSLLRYRPNS